MVFAVRSQDVEITEVNPPSTGSEGEPEIVEVLQESTPADKHKDKHANDRHKKHLATRRRLISKKTNDLERKIKSYNAWLMQRQLDAEAEAERQRNLSEILLMPIVRWVCCVCLNGPYARDDDATDHVLQAKLKDQIDWCERPISKLRDWKVGMKCKTSYETDRWDEARDNAIKHFAFTRWRMIRNQVDSKPKPQPSTSTKTLDLTCATKAFRAFSQVCANYICKTCSKEKDLVNNLAGSKKTYCPECYEDATRKDILKAEKFENRFAVSEAYKAARPNRGLVFLNELPKPHTVLANLSSDYLWSGGSGLKVIKKRPLNLHTYTGSEVDGLLKTILNQFMDLPGWQQPHFVVEDMTRPQDLTVAECKHHFDQDTVDIILDLGYVIHKNKFVLPAEKDKYDPKASSDDSDNSECDLVAGPGH